MGRRVPVTQMGLALPTERPVESVAVYRMCTGCKLNLPVGNFSADQRGPNGLNWRCRECCRDRRGRRNSARSHRVSTCHECSADGLRFCGRCKQHKTRDHFRPVSDNPYGVHSRCVKCDNDRRREKVVRVSASCTVCGATFMLAQSNAKRRRKTCGEPECQQENLRRLARAKPMRDVYRITEDDYQRMFRGQHGKCAICGETDPSNPTRATSDRLCVDHDHRSGTVRGLLCHPCNTGLGYFRDNTERMAAAVKYLLKHKG